MKKKPRVAVRAIITNERGEILLLKRANTRYSEGLWNLPGGKLEYDETVESAIKAEVREETSLEVTASTFYDYIDNLPNELSDKHYVTLVFICYTTGSLKLSDESSEFRWLGKDELNTIDIAFRNAEVIRKFWNL
jgi:mutator protein MutT